MGFRDDAAGAAQPRGWTSPTPLPKSHAPLMSGVAQDGRRAGSDARGRVLPAQALALRNRHSVRAGYTGESDVFAVALPEGLDRRGHAIVTDDAPVIKLRFVRDGSIRGYVLVDEASGRDLLKVHWHGDTSNPFVRATKAFIKSPVPKWDVENYGLFEGMPIGKNLGLIRDVFPDNRVFEPNIDTLPDVPRLEMQVAAAAGAQYYLAVTGVPEPVGEVRSSLLGRVAARSEAYTMILKHMTREEAVLWLTMVVATDMKRRKSVNSKNRPIGAFI